MPVPGTASVLPSALSALPTAAAVSVLCAAVVVEIVAVPAVLLPGGTMTLLAGALIGSGRPALAVALPVVAAIVAGDQLAYFSGAAVTGWWRRRNPGAAAHKGSSPGRAGAGGRRPGSRRPCHRSAGCRRDALPSVSASGGGRHAGLRAAVAGRAALEPQPAT